MSDTEKRLDKLEENHSFSEHTTDQLHEQLVRAHELIDRMGARIMRLEERLASLEISSAQSADAPNDDDDGGGDDDPNADILQHFPPHGAGPKPG